MTGWECEWRRLLGYHAFDSGLARRQIYPALAIGIYVHAALEQILIHKPVTRAGVDTAITETIIQFRQHVAGTEFPVDEGVALIEGMAHCYARIAMPWLTEEFNIIGIEAEDSLKVANWIEWMYRPDFITEHKKSSSLAVHDFKSSASWNENRDTEQYRDNIQMMMNAHAAGVRLKKPIDYYYIHILLKGNDYAPSPLIHPYARPAMPPFQKEDWQPSKKYTDPSGATKYLPKAYERVNVWEHRNVGDWVWSMPEDAAAKQVIVVGPFEVNRVKIERFMRGMQGNEYHWLDRMRGLNERWADDSKLDWSSLWAEPGFQADLDRTFPRTYKCYTYGTRCQFYDLCHRHDRWEDPLGNGSFEKRIPHHEQEEI